MSSPKDLLADAARLLPDLVSLRRTLHAAPEVGLQLPRTQATVLEALAGLGLEVSTGPVGSATTGVVAVLRGGAAPSGGSATGRPTVLLRGDMDALPVVETNDLPYASTNGAMHACGHDLHVAGLVGAARLLAARRDEIAGDVVLMFQPGEEGFGGAKIMIDEGVLAASGALPVAAYGVHVAPGPRGVFSTRPGPLMAGSNQLHITVNGAGGHGSRPYVALDPVPALAEVVTALHTMVTRRFDVHDPVVLSVTQLSAGEALNVIPPSATLGATVRTLSAASVEKLRVETVRVAQGIAAAHGCTAEVSFEVQYPVTVNDAGAAATALEVVDGLLGEGRGTEMPVPLMGSEDFSFVLERVPGAFLFLGASPDGVDPATAAWNHSPLVLFDDAVLGDQAAALAAMALHHLAAS
ncbi:M20 metallopeptidase family protein [Quadrisphaera setariae]|uniref:M20 metallopeptidase family protein n=1 Tax=Quadrisphaera setariae TaxID=2593304 RepID=UPI00164F2C53|nr:M20 family metallopeptidase [Quadrisphaera setariae]